MCLLLSGGGDIRLLCGPRWLVLPGCSSAGSVCFKKIRLELLLISNIQNFKCTEKACCFWSNLMVGDVLVSRGILAYGSVCMCVYTQNQKFLQGSVAITVFCCCGCICMYICNCYSDSKEFLKHSVHLLLHLWKALISLSQIAGVISSASRDHRKKTGMLGKVLLPNRKGEPRLLYVNKTYKMICRFNGCNY